MHLLERNAQQEFDDGSRPFVSNRVRVEMPADTLDEELLRALLDESALSRAMRGVTSNLVEKLKKWRDELRFDIQSTFPP